MPLCAACAIFAIRACTTLSPAVNRPHHLCQLRCPRCLRLLRVLVPSVPFLILGTRAVCAFGGICAICRFATCALRHVVAAASFWEYARLAAWVRMRSLTGITQRSDDMLEAGAQYGLANCSDKVVRLPAVCLCARFFSSRGMFFRYFANMWHVARKH